MTYHGAPSLLPQLKHAVRIYEMHSNQENKYNPPLALISQHLIVAYLQT